MVDIVCTGLVESDKVFTNRVLNNLAIGVDSFFKKIGYSFNTQIRRTIMQHIRNAPEYQSLISSAPESLHAQLGVVDPVGECEELFRVWATEIEVGYKQTRVRGQNLNGYVYVRAIYADFQRILNNPAAIYISENQQGERTPIPWLAWLLKYGKRIIVPTHYYRAYRSRKSRTGLGLMFRMGDRSTAGLAASQEMWRMPPEYSGTIGNNWITRAINRARPDIMRHFVRAVLILQRS